MIAHLIDTDWMADFLKGRSQAVQLLTSLADEGIAISIITYAELYEGLLREPNKARRTQLEELLASVDVLPIDYEVARLFAAHRSDLRDQGLPIPDLDLFIAATALRHDLSLVSRDKHFDRVAGLKRSQ